MLAFRPRRPHPYPLLTQAPRSAAASRFVPRGAKYAARTAPLSAGDHTAGDSATLIADGSTQGAVRRPLAVLRDAILGWGATRSCVRVGRGRCVLRAPSRPISLDEHHW